MNDEPELRCDPVTRRWVLIAPERARRPIALSDAGPRHRTTGERTPCPFCPGQEHETPNEVLAYRDPGSAPNGPGWRLRVVPNKFPAVRPNATAAPLITIPAPIGNLLDGSVLDEAGAPLRPPRAGPDEFPLFHSAAAVGYAEVLIECPEHVDNPILLSDEPFGNVFRAYRERLNALAADPRLAYVTIFKNVGAEAGASLGHTHSQIIATSIVPELIRTELSGAEAHFVRTGRCVFCDIVEQEIVNGSRVIACSENFVVVTAFAPRFAYEMWVLPMRHESRYESISDDRAMELARLLKYVLRQMDGVLHSPAYNWFLHTTPLQVGESPHYHWHLEILPRTARPAGFEWGFGCHITTTSPERAATELRSALGG
jgi:UDPglucose--hexose-1-phosphate uridylyltransferase